MIRSRIVQGTFGSLHCCPAVTAQMYSLASFACVSYKVTELQQIDSIYSMLEMDQWIRDGKYSTTIAENSL